MLLLSLTTSKSKRLPRNSSPSPKWHIHVGMYTFANCIPLKTSIIRFVNMTVFGSATCLNLLLNDFDITKTFLRFVQHISDWIVYVFSLWNCSNCFLGFITGKWFYFPIICWVASRLFWKVICSNIISLTIFLKKCIEERIFLFHWIYFFSMLFYPLEYFQLLLCCLSPQLLSLLFQYQ